MPDAKPRGKPEGSLRAAFRRYASPGARPMRRERLWEYNLIALFFFAFGIADLNMAGDWAETRGGWLTPGALIGVATAAVAFALGIRALLQDVEVRDDEFLVRNIFRTYHLPIDQVEGFRLTRSRWFGNPKVDAD